MNSVTTRGIFEITERFASPINLVYSTTLQSIMNAKLSKHGFWHCHENGLSKTVQTIPHKLYVSFKLATLYCGLRIILVYPNP